MRTSHYLLATEKETPNDAVLISHQLMLRAGLIRKSAAGIYTWLPTGWRVLRKVEAIVRQEMEKAGAIELNMPCVIPADLWQESGRWAKYGPELLRIQDRHDREFCFGPTHEEVITDIFRKEVRSYKQLPLNLFQIQTKFRDEIRPRFGVMRGREFMMKDAYSFHLTADSLQTTYDQMHQAYLAICQRLGLEARAVIADSGSIGGERSHEFQVIAAAGEDDIFYSDTGEYAANIEKASALAPQTQRAKPTETLTEFDTPGLKTIAALGNAFDIPVEKSLKTMIGKNAEGDCFALILRGDHELNEIKVSRLPQMKGTFTLATEADIKANFKAGKGSLGPVNCPIPVIVDRDAAIVSDFVCGANQDDKHFKGGNWDRDIQDYEVADIRNVVVGDASPDGKGTLKQAKGIEIGHIFQLDDVYSTKMNAQVLDQDGQKQTVLMGCYGFGITRVVAAAIEQHHDEQGIVWPQAMAPFQVAIVPIHYHRSETVRAFTDTLYHDLSTQGIEVLLDDRNERPGALFADMDLIGIPHRLVISDKNLDNGSVEYKARKQQDSSLLSADQALAHILERLKS